MTEHRSIPGSEASILLVEDTLSLAKTYEAYLKGEPYRLAHVETGSGALEVLKKDAPDVILLDLVLPDMDGLEILKQVSEENISSEVVVITAHGSVKVAVEAMRLGARDFLVKPFSAERLLVTIRNALDHKRLAQIVETYRSDFDRQEYFGFIGSSLPMQAVYRIIDSAASSKATVFITGESGTGKEVCAEAIHARSQRADKPFVAINCGAIPRDLMESEIFGHVKGAFTGAVSDREGAAKRAEGGTLFLDEICEMDLSLQTKLLRFIQSGAFQKVGGNKTEESDIRFICATNRDPFNEVAEGRFREDLFYRLHVIPIHLPPLRDREDDVLAIARKFLNDFSAEEGKSFTEFSPETEGIFRGYSWPGNIRQLQNVIRNMVVLNEGGEITVDMLPSPLDDQNPIPAQDPIQSIKTENQAPATRFGSQGSPLPAAGGVAGTKLAASEQAIRPLAEVEREIIEHAIALCGDNIPRAAARLGISASTIYRKRTSWEAEDGHGPTNISATSK